jgi:hypothetical protein
LGSTVSTLVLLISVASVTEGWAIYGYTLGQPMYVAIGTGWGVIAAFLVGAAAA